MRVLIITDIEGICGVDSIDMIDESTEDYHRACEYLMADTNAAIDGAFAAGAESVTVVDGHGSGNNFIASLLDPRAMQLDAREFSKAAPIGYDALLCVGAHAMAGTENAFLDHTQSSLKWFSYCINESPCGELAQQGYCLGHFGTPLVMVSGDTAACREALALVPSVATAPVKEANGRNGACSISMEAAYAQIRSAAMDGVLRAREIAPCALTFPAHISLTFTRSDYCDAAMHEGLLRSGRTLSKTLDSLSCYRDLTKL